MKLKDITGLNNLLNKLRGLASPDPASKELDAAGKIRQQEDAARSFSSGHGAPDSSAHGGPPKDSDT